MILRLQYKKNDWMKFVSHLDTVKLFERAFRRCDLPLVFSLGFNPHPKMAFAAPLSVGVSSDYELIDVELGGDFDYEAFIGQQAAQFPVGIELVRGKVLERSKSLMSMVSGAIYRVGILPERRAGSDSECEHPSAQQNWTKVAELQQQVAAFLQQDTIPYVRIRGEGRKRTEQQLDLKPHIHRFRLVEAPATDAFTGYGYYFEVMADAGSVFNLKPEQVIEAFAAFAGLSMSCVQLRVHREMLLGGRPEAWVEMYDMTE